MQHNETNGANESNLTRIYQNGALALTTAYHTCESWQASQHLLDKLWENEFPVNANDALSYGCRQCGAQIHPGWGGTSLRVCRSAPSKSKTLRRRLQRQRIKVALAQRKQAKDTNIRQKQPPSSARQTSSQLVVLLESAKSLVLDRHHLMIRCGRCQATVLCKGLKREGPITKRDVSKQPSAKANVRREYAKKPSPAGKDEVDAFLQLPPSSKKATISTQTLRHPTVSSTLSLQSNKAKKKKGGGKSKLMNFLSSLNG